MGNIFLETERLILRKITKDDFDEIASIIKDKEIMQAWEHNFKDECVHTWIQTCEDRYQDCNLGYLLAVDKKSGKTVGQMGLMPDIIDGKRYIEVAYILKKEFLKQGYAKEGAKALINYGLNVLNEKQIIAEIRPSNTNSIRVAESLGMKLIGEFIKDTRGNKLLHLIYST